MKNRSRHDGALRAIGVWSVAILCGSIVAACSGTIETPTDEFPPREGGSSQGTANNATTTPRTPAATPPRSNPPVASNDDDDPVPPAADDEDPPADDPPADDPPADDPPAGGALSFEADIHPIFENTCSPCHADQGIAGVKIGDADVAAALESAIDFEDRVLARIEMGTMPPPCGGGAPGDAGCIGEDDFADLQAWYEAGAPE